jgi:hypothetical protein
VRNVASIVDADNWQIGGIDLLEDLRIGTVSASTLLEMSVLLPLVLRICFTMLGWLSLLAMLIVYFDVGVKNEVRRWNEDSRKKKTDVEI